MEKLKVTIVLPKNCDISPQKMISLMKWFQKWVSSDIKQIHLEKENNNGNNQQTFLYV